MTQQSRRTEVAALARLFLKLGFTSFGGPAAHIAMMEDEVVARRRWMTRQDFLDLVGATNLIPGPNSTEMAIHIGLRRAGWRGMIVAGAGFLLPAVVIVLALAVAFEHYGATPQGRALLYGIGPAVVVVVAQALLRLGRTALKDPLTILLAAASLAGALLHVNELVLLAGGAAVGLAGAVVGRFGPSPAILLPWALVGGPLLAQAEPERVVSLGRLFLAFLKVGAVLYGSGYVLFAFLRADLVEGMGWLTEAQLIDAIAVGQMTPGPVFASATFIGYTLKGFAGAALATVGIFLPAFAFVAALGPVAKRLRDSWWAGGALDGVNAAALGLLAAIGYYLGREAIVDIPAALVAVGAAGLLLLRANASLLVLAGGAAGLLIELIR